MSALRMMRAKILYCAGVATCALNFGCSFDSTDPVQLIGPPSLEGKEQDYRTEIDSDGDNVVDVFDPGMVVGPAALGTLSESTDLHTATLELSTNSDSISWTCTHQIVPTPGFSACLGTARASYGIVQQDEPGDGARFELSVVKTPIPQPPDTTLGGKAVATIDCGDGEFGSHIFIAEGLVTFSVPVGEDAETCDVTFELEVAQTATEGTATAELVHRFTLTALKVAPIECAHDGDCPGDKGICGPQRACQEGITAQPCVSSALHCDEGHAFCTDQGCSGGFAGSGCRYGGECAEDHTCMDGTCEGDDCNADTDCDAGETCTDHGCSPEGGHLDGCQNGASCGSGLCRSGICQHIAGRGENCLVPQTVCEPFDVCLASSSGECAQAVGAGGTCAHNEECTLGTSCNHEMCASIAGLGDACDDDDDCLPGLPCTAGGTCGNI